MGSVHPSVLPRRCWTEAGGTVSIQLGLQLLQAVFLTTLASPAFVFFAVRGVLPRSLPGVLNSSAMVLEGKCRQLDWHPSLAGARLT